MATLPSHRPLDSFLEYDMALQGSSSGASRPVGTTEFEILKSSHQFLRPDGEEAKELSWNEKVAKKYYDNLYKEFAVCDLKHYKSGNLALADGIRGVIGLGRDDVW